MPYANPDERRRFDAQAKRLKRQYHGDEVRAADRQRGMRRNNSAKNRRPFAGVDGEGATIGSQHRYTLLRAGDHVLKDDAGLSWKQILPFLTSLPNDREYVSFFFDYDVTMILRGGEWRQIVRLVQEGKAWFGQYFVTYMPRKEFKVTKMTNVKVLGQEKPKWVKDPKSNTIRISDTCTFFQTAFVNVIRDWEALTPQLRDLIGAGKERRVVLEHIDEEAEEYNRLECEALAQVMEKLRDACVELELRPRKWQGPANITRAMFAANDVPRRDSYESRIPKAVLDIGRSAYYGGRFEVSQYGHVGLACGVSELDIASAYPAALAEMPCIAHSDWRHGVGTPPADAGGSPRLLKVRARGRHAASYFGLPYRDKDGGVWWPSDVEGWYWDFEVAEAVHQDVEVLEWWEWRTKCDHRPFAWMRDVFEERKRWGKTGKGRVLKLGANSGYGLIAQTVGSPVYACHVMASYITAWCRAKISAAIHAHGCRSGATGTGPCGSNVAMIATDALFVLGESSLALSDSLGGWELKTHPEGLFIVQAGVYFTAEHAKTKARGTPVKLIAERRREFEDAYVQMVESNDPRKGDVYVPCQRFVGLRDAVHRGNAARMGTFVWLGADGDRPGKRIGFDWQGKRQPRPVSADPHGALITAPRDPAPDVRSHAYPKRVPLLDRQTDDTPEEFGQLGLF